MKNLKEMRKEVGYTQAKMAELLRISQQTYSDYENNKTFPDESILIKLADVLNVSVDYLLGRTDELGVPTPSSSAHLTLEEEQLIADWRGLAPPLRQVLKDMIATWQTNTKTATHKKNA